MTFNCWLKCLNVCALFAMSFCMAQPLFNDEPSRLQIASKIVETSSVAISRLDSNNTTVNVETNSTDSVATPDLFSNNSNDTPSERALKRLHDFLKQPYVHSIVLPAMIGVAFAVLTMIIVCCIRSCVRSHVRKKRKQRIRNLADELKTDRSMLLADSSDEEF